MMSEVCIGRFGFCEVGFLAIDSILNALELMNLCWIKKNFGHGAVHLRINETLYMIVWSHFSYMNDLQS